MKKKNSILLRNLTFAYICEKWWGNKWDTAFKADNKELIDVESCHVCVYLVGMPYRLAQRKKSEGHWSPFSPLTGSCSLAVKSFKKVLGWDSRGLSSILSVSGRREEGGGRGKLQTGRLWISMLTINITNSIASHLNYKMCTPSYTQFYFNVVSPGIRIAEFPFSITFFTFFFFFHAAAPFLTTAVVDGNQELLIC